MIFLQPKIKVLLSLTRNRLIDGASDASPACLCSFKRLLAVSTVCYDYQQQCKHICNCLTERNISQFVKKSIDLCFIHLLKAKSFYENLLYEFENIYLVYSDST